MRISTNQMVDNSLLGIRNSFDRLFQAQQRASTGKQVTKPSDDPEGVAKLLNLQASVDTIEQMQRNINDAHGFIATEEAALAQVQGLLQRGRSVGIRGATDSLDSSTLASLSVEIDNILRQLGVAGNSTYGSRFVFGGQRTLTPPFVPAGGGAFTYQGGTAATSDANLVVQTGPTESTIINVTGDKVFTPAFAALLNLRTHLQNGDVVTVSNVDLKALDKAINTIAEVRTDFGGKLQGLQQTKDRLDNTHLGLLEQITNIADADIPKTIVELRTAETAYQAALAATANGFQQSLLDFIR